MGDVCQDVKSCVFMYIGTAVGCASKGHSSIIAVPARWRRQPNVP